MSGTDEPEIGAATPLFPAGLRQFGVPYRTDYAVSRDGRRLLLLKRLASSGTLTVQVGVDWSGAR